jgi:hypothetical protein
LKMKKHLKYLWYLIRHKWYVFLLCIEYGIIWRGIVHDLSKFSFFEWFPYAEKFYGDNVTEEVKERYNRAWNLHKRRNPHHWQYWVKRTASGRELIFPMPDKYRKEMLADWISVSLVNGENPVVWYCKNSNKMKLHPETKNWIEEQLFNFRM